MASTRLQICLALSLSFVGSGAGAQPSHDVVSLDQAVAEALARSHDVASATHRIRAAQAQLAEARWSPYFQFQVEGGAAWVPGATGVQGYSSDSRNQLDRDFGPAIEGKIRGAVPLWTFGKLTAAREAAEAGITAAKGQRERVRNQLLFDVRRAYFGLQLALDVQQMIGEGLPKLLKAQTALQAKLAAGDDDGVDPVDGYRLDTAIYEVQARKSEATRLGRSAEQALALLTGRSTINVPDCPLSPIVVELEPVTGYLDAARASKPELTMLNAARKAKQAQLEEKQARFFPDIALALEAEGRHVPGRTAFEHYIPYYLGAALVARWNLDFWGHYQRERRVSHEQAALAAQNKLARGAVSLKVRTQFETVTSAREQMATWTMSHRVARRWFVSAAQGYEVGTVTPKELVDGVSAYFKARFAHLQSIHDLNIAIAGLEAAIGAPVVPEEAWTADCAL